MPYQSIAIRYFRERSYWAAGHGQVRVSGQLLDRLGRRSPHREVRAEGVTKLVKRPEGRHTRATLSRLKPVAKDVTRDLIFPRRLGRSDYAARAAVWDLNSNSMGLT